MANLADKIETRPSKIWNVGPVSIDPHRAAVTDQDDRQEAGRLEEHRVGGDRVRRGARVHANDGIGSRAGRAENSRAASAVSAGGGDGDRRADRLDSGIIVL